MRVQKINDLVEKVVGDWQGMGIISILASTDAKTKLSSMSTDLDKASYCFQIAKAIDKVYDAKHKECLSSGGGDGGGLGSRVNFFESKKYYDLAAKNFESAGHLHSAYTSKKKSVFAQRKSELQIEHIMFRNYLTVGGEKLLDSFTDLLQYGIEQDVGVQEIQQTYDDFFKQTTILKSLPFFRLGNDWKNSLKKFTDKKEKIDSLIQGYCNNK